MELQRFLLPRKEICEDKELYFRGNFTINEQGYLVILSNETVDTDTYFNSLSYKKYKEYTQIGKVSLEIRLKGACEISLCAAYIDENNIIRRVNDNKVSQKFECNAATTFTLDYKKETEGIIFYIKVKALKDTIIYHARYMTDTPEAQLNKINLAIGICTYMREQFVIKNVQEFNKVIFNRASSELKDHLKIFIADNGRTLAPNMFNNAKIEVFPNINTGGSGGFTRTMIEIMKRKESDGLTHFILMDDDIVIDANVVERNYAFLRLLKKEYVNNVMVGGAMLILSEKYRQFESGAKLDYGYFRFEHKNFNLIPIRNVMENEKEVGNNFNAWCYCCMPTGVLREDNLPLPIFIHMDDAEYGVRNKLKVVNLNGICVWHPFFSNQRGAAIVYYDMRNKMIAMSEKKSINLAIYAKRFIRMFRTDIFRYNYVRTLAACRGIQDYLKGIDAFKQVDPIKLNKELSIYNKPWYDATPDMLKQAQHSAPKESPKVMRKKKLLSLLLPANKKAVVFDCDISGVDVYRAKKLILVNPNTKKYCEYKVSRYLMLKAWFECRKTEKLIDKKMNVVSEEWARRKSEITNLDFWKKYLKLGD